MVKYYDASGNPLTSAPTNAGTYTVKIDVAEGDNYLSVSDLTASDREFTIEQQDITDANITLGADLTYTGSEQTQTIESVTVGSLTLTKGTDYTVSNDTATDAGSGYTLTVTGINNFKGTATKPFTIAKANSEATAPTGLTAVYGRTLANVSLPNGWTWVNSTDSVGDVGIQTHTANFAGDDNHNEASSVDVTVTVTQSGATMTANAEKNNYTYGETVNEPDVSGNKGTATYQYKVKDSADSTYTDSKPTNAGDYTVKAIFAETDLYKEASATADFTIDKKELTPSISGVARKVYDGTSDVPSGHSLTIYLDGIVNNDDVSATASFAYGAADVGTTEINATGITLTGEKSANYKLSTTEAAANAGTITKAESSVTTEPTKAENLVYTGEELALINADGVAIGGTIKYSVDGENFDYEFKDIPKVINAKDDYKVWYKVVGDNNHNDTPAVCIEISVANKPINTAITLTAPVKNAIPQTSIETDEYTATVVWSPEITEGGTFAKSTEYTATITVAPKTNYTVSGIGENGYTLDGATSVTNEADSNNVVTAVFPKTAGSSGGGSSVTRYTVKLDTDGGSTIANQTVTKNVKASEPTEPTKEGYIFDGWYTDSEFVNKYDFDTKVTENITLYAKWVEEEAQNPSDDKKGDRNDKKDDNNGNTDDNKPTTDEWENLFDDVKDNEWYFDNVRYANENGLMSGTTDTTFAPNDNLTRGMLVTVLYRAEGEPAVNKSIPFADVNASQYYANAVIWAQQNGIVLGVSENEFAPDENITREQIAVILYRYAKAMGYDVSVGEDTNILSYTDFDEISEYAIEAMQYAVGSGLMKGKTESTLNPKDNATRAEIAAILNRFIESNK